MRIAVVNWSSRRVGGTEAYLGEILPEIVRAGHDVAFLCETNRPDDREPILVPGSVSGWSVEDLGQDRVVERLRAWKPDVVFVHTLHRPSMETRLLGIAMSVFFAHDYHGTCVSGLKTFQFPRPMPCHRRFGPACLALYFPRHCGGRSPLTMLRLYALQARRLAALRRYDALVTNSAHMRREYLRLGFPPGRVRCLTDAVSVAPVCEDPSLTRRSRRQGPVHLLLLGRMDELKGGHFFLEALRLLSSRFREPLRVTFAGDGPARRAWEARARSLESGVPSLRITFAGWVPGEKQPALFAETDLLVMPSLWPEPFGRSGPEAGRHGIPAVAYDVGGISDWLVDGLNGYLAPGNPPSPGGLAAALLRFLEHPEEHARLAAGAAAHARRFAADLHVRALTDLFGSLLGRAAP